MTVEIGLLFAIVAGAVVLFATEAVAVDVVGLLVLLALYATGILEVEEALAGFASEVVVFLAGLFVVSAALAGAGVMERVERPIEKLAGRRPRLALFLLMAATGGISAFLSNTATMTALLPLALGICRRLGLAPSRILMPLAFASILGGTCTLIGTSTNVVVSGMLPDWGLPRLSLFELAPVGLPLLAIGLLYLGTIGRALLPDRGGETLDRWNLRNYLSEVTVPEGSPWIGKKLPEVAATRELDLRVLGRVEERGRVWRVPTNRPFEAGDILLVEADQETLIKLKKARELDLLGDLRWEERGKEIQIHELLLAPRSVLAGRSIREHDLRRRYEVTVLAVHRRGATRRARLDRIRLHDGDVLLVQGELARLEWLIRQGDLIVLDQTSVRAAPDGQALPGIVFLGMLVAGGTGLVPFSIAAVAAGLLLVLLRRIDPGQVYGALDPRILVMIAGLLGLAKGMEKSGAAEYLAELVLGATNGASPLWLLAALYVLTVLLTQPMSNQAAALVVLPLALRTALQLELDPRPFAITVAIAASCSFLTPLEPASLIVYGPGRYRFFDFFRVGAPLTALGMLVTMLLVPRLWPLQ